MKAPLHLFGTMVLVGCSGAPGAPPMVEPVEDPCITGLLRSTGTEGFSELALRDESGSSTILVGDQRDILLRLAGALVTACGPSVDASQRPEIRVERWTLRSVDGLEAHLGRLAHTSDGWTLEASDWEGDAVALGSVPEALREFVGRTVWLAGRWKGSAFDVGAFGLVR